MKETTTKYRELTVAAVVLGIIQGVCLNVAFVYAALKLGFSIGGSTVAAIMGYAILRGVMRKGTMVENNINQTIASGINTAGTGVVFTVPALFILQAKLASAGNDSLTFEPLPLAIAGIAGAILGVIVIIPLRKQMIDWIDYVFRPVLPRQPSFAPDHREPARLFCSPSVSRLVRPGKS